MQIVDFPMRRLKCNLICIHILQNVTFDTTTSEEVFSGSTVSWFTGDSPAIYLTPLWKSDYVLALSYCAILGVALLIGTLGNVIIIVVTSTTSAMNKVGKQFVINLAISDLCVSGIAEPMCIVGKICYVISQTNFCA